MHSRRHHGGSAAAVAHRPGDSRALGANGCATFEIRRSAAQPGVYQPISPDARDLASVPGGSLRPGQPALSTPSQLHALRAALYDHSVTSRMTARRRRWPLRDVPGLPRGIREPARPSLPRPAERLPGRRAEAGNRASAAHRSQRGTRWPADPIEAARRPAAPGPDRRDQGVGGYHLACDATHAEAVRTLRARKGRAAKPFAVMAADLARRGGCATWTPPASRR